MRAHYVSVSYSRAVAVANLKSSPRGATAREMHYIENVLQMKRIDSAYISVEKNTIVDLNILSPLY